MLQMSKTSGWLICLLKSMISFLIILTLLFLMVFKMATFVTGDSTCGGGSREQLRTLPVGYSQPEAGYR